MVTACHNCTRGPGAACITCKRIDQDDIRIRREPKNRNPDLGTATNMPDPAAAIDGDDDARQGATTLPADDEDALRRFLATVTGLDALAFLAALHLARRGRSRTIADALRTLTAQMNTRCRDEQVARYGRAAILAKYKTITRKIPELAVIRRWEEGHRPGRGRAMDGDGT